MKVRTMPLFGTALFCASFGYGSSAMAFNDVLPDKGEMIARSGDIIAAFENAAPSMDVRPSLVLGECGENNVNFSYIIERWTESEKSAELTIDYYSNFDDPNTFRTALFDKRRYSFKSVLVDEFSTRDLPGYEGRQFVFRRPIEPRQEVAFNLSMQCPNIGYDPGRIFILVDPSGWAGLDKWVADVAAKELILNGYSRPSIDHVAQYDGNILEHFFESEARAENLAIVYTEHPDVAEVLASLENQPWVIDFSMEPMPRGPQVPLLALPKHVSKSLTSSAARADLIKRSIAAALPEVPAKRIRLEIEGSNQFRAIIFAPMTEVWRSERGFAPYWLRVELDISVPSSGRRASDLSTFVAINIRDGWLPKWPRKGEPTESHWPQFELKEHRTSRYTNYEVLHYLKSRLVEGFGSAAGAEYLD